MPCAPQLSKLLLACALRLAEVDIAEPFGRFGNAARFIVAVEEGGPRGLRCETYGCALISIGGIDPSANLAVRDHERPPAAIRHPCLRRVAGRQPRMV